MSGENLYGMNRIPKQAPAGEEDSTGVSELQALPKPNEIATHLNEIWQRKNNYEDYVTAFDLIISEGITENPEIYNGIVYLTPDLDEMPYFQEGSTLESFSAVFNNSDMEQVEFFLENLHESAQRQLYNDALEMNESITQYFINYKESIAKIKEIIPDIEKLVDEKIKNLV